MNEGREQPDLGRVLTLKGALDAGELTADERVELVALLKSDPGHGTALGADVMMDRLVGYASGERLSADDFVRGVRSRIAAEASGEPFVRRVIDRSERLRPRRESRLPAARRPAMNWAWRITALAASILVILGIAISSRVSRLRLDAGSVATVAQVAGAVYVERAGFSRPLRTDDALRPGDGIRTVDSAARAGVVFGDGTRIELSTATVARLEPSCTADHKRLFVEGGRVMADVVPQRVDRSLSIGTPHAEITVIGTRFAVIVAPDVTRTEVLSGQVQALNRITGELVSVGAGQHALFGRRAAVADRPAIGGPRVSAGLEALYTFQETAGSMVRDVSGASPALGLAFEQPSEFRRLPGGGLRLIGRSLLASPGPADRITAACRRTGELTLEAWVRPASADQGLATITPAGRRVMGPARIIALSAGYRAMNCTLGQEGTRLTLRLYVNRIEGPKWLALSTPQGTLGSQRVHIVCTHAATGEIRCYIDGRAVGLELQEGRPATPRDPAGQGLSVWRDGMRLALGDEFGRDREFLGDYYLAAIYSRALTPEEVRQNFRAGVPGSSTGPEQTARP